MTVEKMNVHKALCELKTLDARIEKGIQQTTFVFANKHANSRISGVTVSEFSNEIKANYQSVTSLIARRDAIKRAVTLSNAIVKVVIAGHEYTVAEAIEKKNNGIPQLQKLLRKLEADNYQARRDADFENRESLEKRADEYVRSLYGNIDIKGAVDEIKRVRGDFIAAQAMEIVDPIGICGEMERLEKEINEFTVEIDSALSVANALTELTIEY